MGSSSRNAPVGIDPYTSSVLTCTNRRTPALRAAMISVAVPTTSVSMNSVGLCSERSTWLSAARLMTTSQPSTARAATSGSAMSPWMNEYRGSPMSSATFAVLPA